MDIRSATVPDLQEIQDIDIKSFDEVWEEQRFLNLLEETRVAVIDGRVVGFCVAEENRKVVNVFRLAVTPSFRRMGVAGQLLADLVLTHANEQLIRVKVDEYNVSTQLFLRASTFQAIRTIDTNIIFEKRLDDA
ncbi:MAG: GNAT family N-acetyltransferase [Candidatus Competibacteraceae bacterium]|nr:GNAT family N-acetyltransferase [Candidatus Competibacteraceae bacterium]